MEKLAGTGRGGAGWRTGVSAPQTAELSQNFFTDLFYLPTQNEAPAGGEG